MPELLRALKNRLDIVYTLQFGSNETTGEAPQKYDFKPGEVRILPLADKQYDWALGRTVGVNLKNPDGSEFFAMKRVFDPISLTEAMKVAPIEDRAEIRAARAVDADKEAERKAIAADVIEQLRKEGRLKDMPEPHEVSAKRK